MYSKQPSTHTIRQNSRQASENLKPVDALQSFVGRYVEVWCDEQTVVTGELKEFVGGKHGPLGRLVVTDPNNRTIIIRKWALIIRGDLEGGEDYARNKVH